MTDSNKQAFEGWAKTVTGKRIDVDGAFGVQCWDLAARYSIDIGTTREAMSTVAGPFDQNYGYASALVRHFYSSPLRVQNYDLYPPSAVPQPGWVAVWGFGTPGYPLSHVAIVQNYVSSNYIDVLTQNPEQTPTFRRLTTNGLLGYLRPKKLAASASPEKGPEVIAYHKEDKLARTEPGRKIAPGESFYLHTDPTMPTSNAVNIVGGIGQYSITLHAYVEGAPGDSAELVLLWTNDPSGKTPLSPNYIQKITIPSGPGALVKVMENVEFKRYVPKGYMVYAQFRANKTNKAPMIVSLFDADAFLYV